MSSALECFCCCRWEHQEQSVLFDFIATHYDFETLLKVRGQLKPIQKRKYWKCFCCWEPQERYKNLYLLSSTSIMVWIFWNGFTVYRFDRYYFLSGKTICIIKKQHRKKWRSNKWQLTNRKRKTSINLIIL